MIDSLRAAEQECTKDVDIKPEKVLRPIGTTFKEWIEELSTTELPHWVTWEIVGYEKTFSGRRGNTLLFERMEEIKLVTL